MGRQHLETGDTQREAGGTPAGRAAVATPHPKGGYLPSGGGRRGWWADAEEEPEHTPPPSLPPLAANHAMETTFFSLMRRGRRRRCAGPNTSPSPPTHFYFCLKKSQLQRLKLSTEAEN